jgi:hypothetical protein
MKKQLERTRGTKMAKSTTHGSSALTDAKNEVVSYITSLIKHPPAKEPSGGKSATEEKTRREHTAKQASG